MTALQTDATANEDAVAALARARKGRLEPVLIIGGGIGGLATALALAQRGIPSHVLERRAAFNEEGAGIQLGPNATRILRRLGVADALRPHVGVPEAISVRDGASGRQLASLPLGRWIAMRHGAPYWVALRSDLHAALVDAARDDPLVALSMGFTVSELATDGEQVAVANGSGQAWTGKALIAADGVWSGIRERVFGTPQPDFVGKSATRTVLGLHDAPPEFHRPETGLWLFPDAHVVHYPVAAGAAIAIVVIADDEHEDDDWSAPVHPAWVQHRLPQCPEELGDLIGQGRTWRRWALHTLPPQRRITRNRIALLGDAAHPILPFLAQGGAMALEDATVLAEAMYGSGGEVAAALRAYESRRRARTARVAAASQKNGRAYHYSGMRASVRNFMLEKLPPQRLIARYDWLYGWRGD